MLRSKNLTEAHIWFSKILYPDASSKERMAQKSGISKYNNMEIISSLQKSANQKAAIKYGFDDAIDNRRYNIFPNNIKKDKVSN